MMTGRDLAKLFDDFNARAWAGRLPRYHLRRTPAPALGHQGICKTTTRTIVVYTDVDDADVPGVLLHEMCHIRTPSHGRRFMAELRSAALAIGEAWALEQVQMQESAVKPSASVALTDLSQSMEPQRRPPWGTTRRLIAQNLGLPLPDFDRRYPWARGKWARLREEAIRDEARNRALGEKYRATARNAKAVP